MLRLLLKNLCQEINIKNSSSFNCHQIDGNIKITVPNNRRKYEDQSKYTKEARKDKLKED